MNRSELSNVINYTLDNVTTINFAAFASERKGDESLSTQMGFDKVIGQEMNGCSMTFYFEPDWLKEHRDEVIPKTDELMQKLLGLQHYYRGKLSSTEQKDGVRLYNLIQAMNILRGVYGETRKSDLDAFWNLKMAAKASGSKVRTRLKFGAKGDHIHVKNKKGEVMDRITVNEPGSGMTMIRTEDVLDFTNKAKSLQDFYEGLIEPWEEDSWSNDKMFEVLCKVVEELNRKEGDKFAYWPSANKKSNPLDIEMVKKFVTEAGKYLEVDTTSLMLNIKF